MFSFFKKKKTNQKPTNVNINGKTYPALIRKKNGRNEIWHEKDQKWVGWNPDVAKGDKN